MREQTPVREQHYDEVFDAQRHFRLLLDSMARPGQVREFTGLTLSPPPPLSPAAAAIALALLDTNVSFACAGYGEGVGSYLRANTSSREAAIPEADFLFFAPGAADPATVAMAKPGLLAYPDQGATLIMETAGLVEAASFGRVNGNETAHGLRVTLSGPGVDGTVNFGVQGLTLESLDAVRRLNREYPLGVELVLTAGNRFVSVPRSSAIAWE